MPDLIDLYAEELKRRGRMDSSLRVITSSLRTVADDCGPLERLTSDQVTTWLDTRRTNRGSLFTSRTRWGYIAGLNRFFTWAVETGHLDKNPVADMSKPPLEETVAHVVTTNEVDQAIRNASSELRCWLTIAAYQGLRPQDVALLEREDIDTNSSPPTLRIRRRDGTTERSMELHPRALHSLELLPIPEHGGLFPSATAGVVGTRINRHMISLGLKARADGLRTWYRSDEYWRADSAANAPSISQTDTHELAPHRGDQAEKINPMLVSYPLVIDGRTRRMLRHSIASRKAVVLIGPPGTGKTRLACESVDEISADYSAYGFSKPPIFREPVTPDESWTATEIVGGPTVHDGNIVFRPGYILRAIRDDAWLMLDEANRADLDKILGGLLTWLSEAKTEVVVGRLSEAPDSPEVTVGWNMHPASEVVNGAWLDDPLNAPRNKGRVRFLAGQEWRLLATYNAVDAQRVFRFGQALGRRFATVPIFPPDVEVVRDLLMRSGTDLALPVAVAERVSALYSAHFADGDTVLGPAQFLEIPSYVAAAYGTDNEDEVPLDVLEDLIAEGYLINVGLGLARLGDDELGELGTRIEDERGLSARAWTWVTDQLLALR